MHRAIDLYCGAGGLSLGLGSVPGLEVVAAVDNDAVAIGTYKHNLGDHAHRRDLGKLDPHDLLEMARLERGECTLLAGGPPCQGFSIQRRGKDKDERNHLVLRFLDFIEGVQPRFFLMENVRGLLSKRGRPYFEEFKARTEDLGYVVHVDKLNAAHYGVPQERIRVFLVGELVEGASGFGWPLPTHAEDGFRTVRETIGDLPVPPSDGSPHSQYPLHFREGRLSKKNLERFEYIPEGGGRDDLPPHLQLRCHIENPSHRHKDVYGRMSWDRPAPTLTARFDSFSRGRFGHPVDNRTITLREGARLQTFPDDFHFFGNREQVARQIGNAVPPLLAKSVAQRIVSCLDGAAAVHSGPGPLFGGLRTK